MSTYENIKNQFKITEFYESNSAYHVSVKHLNTGLSWEITIPLITNFDTIMKQFYQEKIQEIRNHNINKLLK